MEHTKARRWIVRGAVQGVGFRFFVQHKATALGVRGWARNLDDGTVEVYGTGSEDRLNDMASALHKGPEHAAVRGVEEHAAAVEQYPGFSIR